MIIEIKNQRYQDPDWRVDNGIALIRLSTSENFLEVAERFSLEEGDIILQYNDSNALIGKWYVQGMCSIKLPGEEGEDKTVIKYHISQISKDAQRALNMDIEDTSDATLELVAMVSQFETNLDSTLEKVENDWKSESTRITGIQQIMNLHTASIGQLETMYSQLADRVARLENGGR